MVAAEAKIFSHCLLENVAEGWQYRYFVLKY